MPGPCKSCGADSAPFGFRRRGFMRDLPEAQRTMIFVCGAPDCMARAKAWKEKADGVAGLSPRPRNTPKSQPSPKPKPAQGSLF